MGLKNDTTAIDIASMTAVSDFINRIANRKIIYIGEVHDVFAHHAVQLDIVKGIYRKNRKTAIGMEMFQGPFQEVLDSFIAGRINEKDFLEKSEYFKRWGLDYNLYKPILDFARTENLPVIALNLQRETVKKVSANGIDSLSDEEKNDIPEEMDFSDKEYKERLKETFRMHEKSGIKNFDYFYQAQILWDETMSQSVYAFIQKNSEYQIVVLAGQGHLRFGSGIPKRTYRRNGLEYAVVLLDDKIEEGIADFVVFTGQVKGFSAERL